MDSREICLRPLYGTDSKLFSHSLGPTQTKVVRTGYVRSSG